ncbi:MAG: 4-hydroxy-3-methylbut-2-enyl diphosphate reductase [Blautia sp.]|nr:4-hydroxy-3-methylbut-2-enyl diphosphate reductase [Blautia sp.]
MRNVTVAKSAGFCFGVRRAVELVYREAEQGEIPIYTYGPIIHNEQVVSELSERGVMVVTELSKLSELPAGKVIIRSHGISRSEYEAIKESGHELLDATCPFVQKIHRLVEEYSERGFHIVIAGDREHPEVQGIMGWAKGAVYTLKDAKDLQKIPIIQGKKVCLVAQTTFNYNKFQDLVEIIGKKGYDISVLNTICSATGERQAEARMIAGVSEAMIVIGDRHSSNTQKLFEICKKECANTYYIQTSSDMDYQSLGSINNVGITAGASTPNNIIEEVSKNVRNEL